MIGLIFGRIRAGKSSLARHLTKGAPRIFYVDPTYEMRGKHVLSEPEDFEAFASLASDPASRWTASAELDLSDESEADYLFEFLYQLSDCVIVIDELAEFVKGGKIKSPWLRRLVYRGGHYNLHLLCISQFPSQVSLALRTVAARVYSLALAGEQAAYVRKTWGLEPPTENYRYVSWSAG